MRSRSVLGAALSLPLLLSTGCGDSAVAPSDPDPPGRSPVGVASGTDPGPE